MKKHGNHAGTRHNARKGKLAQARSARKLSESDYYAQSVRTAGHLKPGHHTRRGVVQNRPIMRKGGW